MHNYKKYCMGWKINKITKINEKDIMITNNEKDIVLNINKKNTILKIYPQYYNLYEKYPNYFPEILDQQQLDSCVSNCISTIYYYLSYKQNNLLKFKISILYLHDFVKKSLDKIYDDDNNYGTTIIDCLKACNNTGVCPEFLYSNNTRNDKINKISNFCKLQEFFLINKYNIKEYLTNDYPVICGIQIFESFHLSETIRTGIIILPNYNDILLGGHSIVIIGYDDIKLHFIFINSWGNKWGDNGIGYLPYSYLYNNDYSDEFYILKKISNPDVKFFNCKKKIINIIDLIMIISIMIILLLLQIKKN